MAGQRLGGLRGRVDLVLVAALACAGLVACGKQEKEEAAAPPPAAAPGSAAPVAKGEGEEPQARTRSRFLGELAKADYPDAPAPDTPLLLRWDFSAERVSRYGYQQTFESRIGMAMAMPDAARMDQAASAEGKLLIKSKGDGTADVVLQDMTITTAMRLGTRGKEELKPATMTAPPLVVQGLKEDGTLKVGASEQEMLLKLLFPLPTKPLNVGESVDVPAEMPFNAMGSLLMVQGRSRITLTKYVTIARHTCARLDTDIDISRLDVPAELEGKYACSTKGASVFYFDIEDRRFVSGALAILMTMAADAPPPKFRIPGVEPPKPSARMRADMGMDTLIRITPLHE